jgi:hypothetical protein
VGEGPGRWERLPPTETRSHESKAMSYAFGARSPQQLQTPITSMCGLGFSQPTTLSSSTFYVDAYGHLTCPIWISIEEVMPL